MKRYTAKTLDDILNNAAKEKDVAKEELIYYVLEEKQGFFGIGSSVSAEVFALVDVKNFVEEYLFNLFDGLGLSVKIEVIMQSSNVKVFLNADNNAIIIGKNGKSLEALNLVLKNVVNAQFKRRFYVLVDINNYKNNRYQKLKEMARRVGKTVQRTKVSVSLDPMPNDERRVIHKELTEMAHVRTESQGAGKNRHLKIVYDPNKE